MRISSWIPKATNTHSEYVIRVAFPLQEWLYERAVMLHYTYIACLANKLIVTAHLFDKIPITLFEKKKKPHRYMLRSC